ncbi:hypothetical protein KBC79_00245 [Candidatus Woesebacteria bacterium]|nr:hypothetical protein [Candidatus Woesebacteria bacterium]
MFRSARFKLTLWYSLIIMMVSILFSLIIYKTAAQEIDRFSLSQRSRIQRQLRESEQLPIEIRQHIVIPVPPLADPDLVAETKLRFVILLAILNGSIFLLASLLGYVLAGKTLRPIQAMVSEQNRFISDASHELRTPLTALKASLEVALRDQKLSAGEARQVIEESLQDVNKLQVLSDNLLHLAQYRKPIIEEFFEPAELAPILTKAEKTVHALAKKKKILIELGDAETPVIVWGQSLSLQELFVIILDNAIKYSPPESIISIEPRLLRRKVRITISDQGSGIKPEALPHIFDRFYRADNARQHQKAGGYGLGLAIAKEIVLRHEGSITVQSEVDKGTLVSVVLPRIKSPTSV